MDPQKQEAFFTLTKMVSRHTTTIDQKMMSSFVGVQPPASGGIGTYIGGDKLTSHVPQRERHVCTSCGQPCYGPGPRHGTSMMTGGQVRTLLNSIIIHFKIFPYSM